jgi:hypothetical protein
MAGRRPDHPHRASSMTRDRLRRQPNLQEQAFGSRRFLDMLNTWMAASSAAMTPKSLVEIMTDCRPQNGSYPPARGAPANEKANALEAQDEAPPV